MRRNFFRKVGVNLFEDAAVIYSAARRVNPNYTGDLIRVRESGGNTLSNIGFDVNGNLDTTALLAHCGANDGFVVTWYDQSGNGNNATQGTASNQPKIVSSGSLITVNSKPSILFKNALSGGNILLNLSNVTSAETLSLFSVVKADVQESNRVFLNISDGSNASSISQGSVSDDTFGYRNLGRSNANISTASNLNQSLLSAIEVSSTASFYLDNSLALGTNTNRISTSGSQIGNNGSSTYGMNGKLQEIIIYTLDQSTNRAAIESNINSYYSIY